jgi:hypothetical protein
LEVHDTVRFRIRLAVPRYLKSSLVLILLMIQYTGFLKS